MKKLFFSLLVVFLLCACESAEDNAKVMFDKSKTLITEKKHAEAAKLLTQLVEEYKSTDIAKEAVVELRKTNDFIAEKADERARNFIADFSETLLNYLTAKGGTLENLTDLDFEGQKLPLKKVPDDINLFFLKGTGTMKSVVYCYAEQGKKSYIIENADSPPAVRRWSRLARHKMAKRFSHMINSATVAEEYKGVKKLVRNES